MERERERGRENKIEKGRERYSAKWSKQEQIFAQPFYTSLLRAREMLPTTKYTGLLWKWERENKKKENETDRERQTERATKRERQTKRETDRQRDRKACDYLLNGDIYFQKWIFEFCVVLPLHWM